MINIPSDFSTAKAYEGGASASALTPGGHICRIKGARVEKSRKGNDMLVVAFDIAEGGPFDGWYNARHERSKTYNPDAKWQGVFRAPIQTQDGRTGGYFKGLITAVEDSNSGYKFVGEEKTLTGKLVGFNFGEEEYLYNGEVRVSVKPFWAVGVDRVKAGIEPPKRKALKQEQMPSGFVEVPNEELPDLPFD